jgi:hypothetical protein
MSRILIFFIGNRLANVGSEDVELLGLLDGVCCTLVVECTLVDLTGVVCVGFYIAIVEVTVH